MTTTETDDTDATLGDIRRLLARSVDLQERGIARLDEERYWRRRMGVVLGVAALVLVLCLGGWVSVSRQADCDLANRDRSAAIESAVQTVATTWDEVADDEAGKARLLAAVRRDQERLRPVRDCAWPA